MWILNCPNRDSLTLFGLGRDAKFNVGIEIENLSKRTTMLQFIQFSKKYPNKNWMKIF